MELYFKIQDYISLLIQNFSNVKLNTVIIFCITILFILLSKFRHGRILSSISILFSFFPVLIHELGHALSARLVGGHVDNIHMVLTQREQVSTERQGYAETRANSNFKFIIITFCGYIAPPIMLFLGVYLAYKEKTFIYLFICIGLLIFYFAVTKQKWIPIILLIAVSYSCYNIIIQQDTFITNSISFIYNVLLGLVLGEIIQSIIITTKITFNKKGSEWDGTAMKNLTLIPVFFWWLLWTTISCVSIYKVLNMLFS